VDLDARAVDEQSVGGVRLARQRAENPLPYAALRPAHEAIVEGLLRPVDLARTIRPAAAAFERVHDPAQHPAVIDARLAPRVRRQQRLDPSPLRIRKPKEIRHLHRLLTGDNESRQTRLGNPLNGSGP